MALIDFQQGPGDDGSPPPDPRPDPIEQSWDDKFGQLNSFYQTTLGRTAGETDTPFWLRRTPTSWDFATPDWKTQITNSPEAVAYRAKSAAAPPPAAAAGSLATASAFGSAWLQYANGLGRRPTSNDITAFTQAHPELGGYSIGGSKGNKITIGGRTYKAIGSTSDPNAAFAQWLDITDGEGGGGDAAGYTGSTETPYKNSASTELFVNEILSRLQQLHQPINDPLMPLLQSMALARVKALQGAPFTEGEDAALVARYREPLTQARDAEYLRNREQASARGFGKDSGLIDLLDAQTGRSYQRAVAQGSNDLATTAITEKNRRGQEVLAILASLEQAAQGQRTEQNSNANELLRVAAMLPDLDERRLGLLLQASNDGGAANSSLSTLLQLANLGQNQNQFDTQNSQNSADAWGQYIAQILASLGGH